MQELQQLEAEHPELVTADSPTQRLGDQPVEGLDAGRASRADAVDREHVQRRRSESLPSAPPKPLDGEPIEWVVELKIDGVAVSLTYENGVLVRGGHPRQRPGRRRHHAQRPHDARRAAAAERQAAAGAGSPRRSLHDQQRSGEAQRTAGGSRRSRCMPITRNVAAGSIRLLDPRSVPRSAGCGCLPTASAIAKDSKSPTHIEFLKDLAALRPAADAASPLFPRRRRGGRALRRR